MGVIKLEYVIRYSSQDEYFKVDNILQNPGYKPWLCSPYDKSGKLEAEFQLETASCIEFIDIGNLGCSLIEIEVGKSAVQQKTSYKQFLPITTLVDLVDIKAGVALNSVYMFNKNNFVEALFKEKWNRIKVICYQPFKKHKQFGLAFMSLRTTKSSLKLDIGTHTSLSTNAERLVKFVPKKTHTSQLLDSGMSRGAKLVHASKSQNLILKKKLLKRFMEVINSSSASSTSQMLVPPQSAAPSDLLEPFHPAASSDSFKEDCRMFLIACYDEDKLVKPHDYYIHHFQIQRKKEMDFKQAQIFVHHFCEIKSTNDCMNALPQQSEIMIDAFRNTNDYDTSLETLELKTTESLSDATQALETPPGSPESLEDIIQHDGVEPSTSKGFSTSAQTHCCPICGRYFLKSKIEVHASKCGEIPSAILNNFPMDVSSDTSLNSLDSDILLNDQNGPCPFCMFSFPKSELEQHVATCLYRQKSHL